jgi:hypothetical protein
MIRRAVRKRRPLTCVAGSMPSSRSVEDPARDGKSKGTRTIRRKNEWCGTLAWPKGNQEESVTESPYLCRGAMPSARSSGGTRLATAWKVLVPEA